MAGFLRTIAQGIGSGLNRMAVGSTGGLLNPGERGSSERRQNIGAGLSDIGYLISSRGLGGSPYSQQLASNRQAEQQALIAQQKERQALEIQAKRQEIANQPGKTPAQIAQELAMFEASIGNAAAATAAGGLAEKFAPPEVRAPEIVDPDKLVTVDGPNGPVSGFYTADKQFNQVERQPIPGTDIEIITDATGAKRAVNKASLRGGEVLAEGKAEEKRYVTFERNGQTYVGDPASRTAAPFVDANGKPIQEIPKPATSEDRFSDTLRLGQAYTAELKDTTQIVRAYAKLQAAANDPSAAGDLSIIFSYMKMLDPGSTVREGEQATAENARSVPDSIRARWNKVIAGEKLGPDQRADFINKAKALVTSQRGDAERTAGRYRSLAKASGLNPDLVTFDPFEGISTGVSDEEFDSLFK